MLVSWRCGLRVRASAHDHGLIRKLPPSGVFLSGDNGTLSARLHAAPRWRRRPPTGLRRPPRTSALPRPAPLPRSDAQTNAHAEAATSTSQIMPSAMKAALHRGRTRLRELGADGDDAPQAEMSEADRKRLSSYVAYFNARDFDAIRAITWYSIPGRPGVSPAGGRNISCCSTGRATRSRPSGISATPLIVIDGAGYRV